MEERTVGMGNVGQLAHRLHAAHLGIGCLYRYQHRIRLAESLKGASLDEARARRLDEVDLVTLVRKVVRRAEYGIMLDGGHDDMRLEVLLTAIQLAPLGREGHPGDGSVVRFSGPRGEDDLVGTPGIQRGGHHLARLFQGTERRAAR